MSQGDYVKIDSKKAIETQLPFLLKRIESWDYSIPLVVKFERYDDPRSNKQCRLFHKWCEEMSQAFIGKVPDATKDGMKFMMKHMFLGTQTIKVGKETYNDQIMPLPEHKGDMCYFMDQVHAWAAEKKVFLSLPQYNEYTLLKQKQDK
jgi:hypothetical protein|tara:strand:- start:378 stop:821 length:444 start_codon:yes stop_codon:yes gene_type:complete